LAFCASEGTRGTCLVSASPHCWSTPSMYTYAMNPAGIPVLPPHRFP
jgi:hypothetical protein